MDTVNRMSDDVIRHRLQELIELEPDPKERARLLIMMQISGLLIDNVQSVRTLTTELHEHRSEFSIHIDEERKLFNQGRGAWRVFLVSVAIVQGLLGYIYFKHIDEMREIKKVVAVHERQIYSMDGKLEQLLKNNGSVIR